MAYAIGIKTNPRYAVEVGIFGTLRDVLLYGDPETEVPSEMIGELPVTTVIRERKKKTIPGAFITGGIWVVNDRFRAGVEQLEPDTHQFIPIQIFRKDRTIATQESEEYYILHVLQHIECVNIEKSDVHWGVNESTGNKMLYKDKTKMGGYILYKKISSLHHLYADKFLGKRQLFVSNELHDVFQKDKSLVSLEYVEAIEA